MVQNSWHTKVREKISFNLQWCEYLKFTARERIYAGWQKEFSPDEGSLSYNTKHSMYTGCYGSLSRWRRLELPATVCSSVMDRRWPGESVGEFHEAWSQVKYDVSDFNEILTGPLRQVSPLRWGRQLTS